MNNFDKIVLEKGMYEAGNLSDVLEQMDPSEDYRGTALQDLDAFSRQLKRYDIKVSGSNSDTVEKFFANSNSAVLFPEYVRRCVQIGIDENDAVHDIVANTIDISGFDYRSVYSESNNKQASLSINTYDNLVPMQNFRKHLHASYESLRFQRISTLSLILQQIGCYIAKCQYRVAVELLYDSEYLGEKSASSIISEVTKALHAKAGYKLTTLICSSSVSESLRELLKSDIVFKDNNYYCGETKLLIYPSMSCGRIVGLDNRYALEMIRCGSLILDYEKLIDRQFENVDICQHAGFSVVCPDAVVSIKPNWLV